MIVREAYFDEAGTHGNDVLLMVAGLISRAEDWQRFNEKFIELTGSPEAARLFKAKTCNDEQLLCDAAKLAIDHSHFGFAISVRASEYTAAASPRLRSQWGSPYTMCLKEATSQVGEWANLGNIEDPIAYFFDAGHRNQEQANQYFRKVYTSWPQMRAKLRLGSWTFADDELVLPLKAADILAYGCHKHETDGSHRQLFETLSRQMIFRYHITPEDVAAWTSEVADIYERRKARRK